MSEADPYLKGGDKFGKTKNRYHPPNRPFAPADGCKIVAADSTMAIEWQRIEGRRWERICDCGTETTFEPAPSRVRQDPYDPATSRHAGQCEFKNATDRDILKVLLRVKPGLDEGYMWVTCGSCEHEWAVADYAEESVR